MIRTVVTVFVVGFLAWTIFSLRQENAELRGQLTGRILADASRTAAAPGVLEAIATRTSIRKFDPAVQVSTTEMDTILRSAMCAPSAMNKQPWEFVVVRDPGQLRKLAEALPYSRVGNGANAAIVVCGNLDNGLPGRGREYWVQDCSAASMNILLAVTAQGLGAVWTGVYPGEDRIAAVRKILGIPEGFMPLNVIPIGKPAESPSPKDKWNVNKIHTDRW